MKDLAEVRRWLTLRCEHCGHRFRWKRDPRHSFGGNPAVYHSPCQAYLIWQAKAEERLNVLAVVCDLSGVTERDVATVVELRATDEPARIAASNRVFRVFHDLDNHLNTPPLTAENR